MCGSSEVSGKEKAAIRKTRAVVGFDISDGVCSVFDDH